MRMTDALFGLTSILDAQLLVLVNGALELENHLFKARRVQRGGINLFHVLDKLAHRRGGCAGRG